MGAMVYSGSSKKIRKKPHVSLGRSLVKFFGASIVSEHSAPPIGNFFINSSYFRRLLEMFQNLPLEVRPNQGKCLINSMTSTVMPF